MEPHSGNYPKGTGSALVTRLCVYVCVRIVSTYLSLCVTERGEVQELRIKHRGRERQDYTHGRLEKAREREGEDGRKKRQREA